MVTFRLQQLTTKSGTVIDVPPAGVVCVVGGNNVGKSQMLREIPQILSGREGGAVVLARVAHSFAYSSADELSRWFAENGIRERHGDEARYRPRRGGSAQPLRNLLDLAHQAHRSPSSLHVVLPWFLQTLDAASRAGIATAEMGHVGVDDTTGTPLHQLFRDGDMAAELSAICQRTFGFPLTLDRANANVCLRVGVPGVESPPLQHPTREYADAVVALPALAEQGDGVKNYLGMVLHLMTAAETVTIIDEPEAFLHPAQARRLGRHLGEEAAKHDRQAITATHDRDFVLGLLASGCPLVIVRLDRAGDVTTATTISSAEVESIWDRAVLRYSNLLQGLFHRAVAVCEADADCRWYAAVLDGMGRAAGIDSEEALFVPSGGKDQVPVCLEALRGLDVRTFAILDFDAVLEPQFVSGVLKALDVEDGRALQLSNAVASQVTTPERRQRAKESGLSGLPAGDATRMASELLQRLGEHGVLVLPVGELESFDRTLGGHSSAWVSAALTNERHASCPEAEGVLAPLLEALRVGASAAAS